MLSERHVHVWVLRTSVSDSLAAKFEPLLMADEKERAARFRFDHLRRSFIVTRGTLRCLLGYYLDVHPTRLRCV